MSSRLHEKQDLTVTAISPEAEALIAAYQLPDEIPFGEKMAPVMYSAVYRDGAWQPGSLVPFDNVPVNPASTALQFAQQAFEGMKAYRGDHARPVLFRPDMNWRRFARSAKRLSLPVVPSPMFAESCRWACRTQSSVSSTSQLVCVMVPSSRTSVLEVSRF